jgi:hypothetical protein
MIAGARSGAELWANIEDRNAAEQDNADTSDSE